MAKKTDVKILFDYVCFTVSLLDFLDGNDENYHYEFIRERIESKFMLSGLTFSARCAFNGYNYSYWSNGIVYCFGGQDHIYIQMSGTGCRTWESLHPGLTWDSWIRQLQATYGSLHFSRLDVACDTFNLLDIRKIQMATMGEQFVSKWRTYLCQVGNKENSVIFGSAKSNFRLRIYDKTAERKHALGKQSEQDIPENWLRLEYQLRDEAVLSFLRPWQDGGDISEVFFGILKNQLLYYTQFDGHNYDRIKLKPWWKQLLGNVGKIKMAYQGGVDYNLQRLQSYVIGQAGSSIRTYISAYDGDISKLLGAVNSREYNDRQRALLEQLHK